MVFLYGICKGISWFIAHMGKHFYPGFYKFYKAVYGLKKALHESQPHTHTLLKFKRRGDAHLLIVRAVKLLVVVQCHFQNDGLTARIREFFAFMHQGSDWVRLCLTLDAFSELDHKSTGNVGPPPPPMHSGFADRYHRWTAALTVG